MCDCRKPSKKDKGHSWGVNMELKRLAENHKRLFATFAFIYSRFLGRNIIKMKNGNYLKCPYVMLRKCRIEIHGKGNKIVIGKLARLYDCTVQIYGNDNAVILGDAVYLNQAQLYMEDDSNLIEIGDKSSIQGKTGLAVIEGTSIKIGKDCLLSGDINFRTGDSHSLLNLSGKRINPSKSIEIGDHVWIGTRVLILKGVKIPSGGAIGAGSLCNKQFEKENCVIAGNPAKVVKENITWCHERININ